MLSGLYSFLLTLAVFTRGSGSLLIRASVRDLGPPPIQPPFNQFHIRSPIPARRKSHCSRQTLLDTARLRRHLASLAAILLAFPRLRYGIRGPRGPGHGAAEAAGEDIAQQRAHGGQAAADDADEGFEDTPVGRRYVVIWVGTTGQ